MAYWSSAVSGQFLKSDVNIPTDISLNCSSFINQSLCVAATGKCAWATHLWSMDQFASDSGMLATRDAGEPAVDTCAYKTLYFPLPRYIPFWHLPFITAASIMVECAIADAVTT